VRPHPAPIPNNRRISAEQDKYIQPGRGGPFVVAWAYTTAGRFDDATSLREDVLRRRKSKLGPDHLDKLISMFFVPLAYWLNECLFEAIPLFEEVLKLQKAELGLHNISTAVSVFDSPTPIWTAVGERSALPGQRPLLDNRRRTPRWSALLENCF
jgi:hypothetical protein